MSAPRHLLVTTGPRHPVRRLLLPAGAALLVTGALVGTALVRSEPAGGSAAAATSMRPQQPAATPPSSLVTGDAVRRSAPAPLDSPYLADRRRAFSRSAQRVTLVRKPTVTDHEFATARLNLWPQARERGEPLRILDEGGRLAVTGRRENGFAQILYAGQVRWVNADYLAERKPDPVAAGTSAGLSSAPCPDGSSTESGLTSSAVRLFRSACQAFPALSSYGGWDAHGEHSSGRAIDFMVTDPALGSALATWAQAHAGELGLYDIIWQQRIWTPVRASEGWRGMSDRGSATANHFDHVHIAVN